jgi:hypothetical protein
MASLRFNKQGLASGTVEICQFPYNCLGAQVDTMQLFDADGIEITDTVPSGSIVYQYLSADDGSEWRNFDIAAINNVQDGSNQVPHVTGNRVTKVRATFSGFPEGTTFNAWCFGYSFPNAIIDSRVVGGVKAFNVQSFTENNCKSGTQHEFSVYIPSLGAGDSYYIAIQTSDDPILVKSFNVQFDGALTSAVWFKNPTIATLPDPITIYNLNDELAVPFKSSVYLNVTPSSAGDQISPVFMSIGNEGSNNKKVSSDSDSPDAGLERVLWRNRLYLWKITNENADACKVSIVASMYEGGLSIER